MKSLLQKHPLIFSFIFVITINLLLCPIYLYLSRKSTFGIIVFGICVVTDIVYAIISRSKAAVPIWLTGLPVWIILNCMDSQLPFELILLQVLYPLYTMRAAVFLPVRFAVWVRRKYVSSPDTDETTPEDHINNTRNN